MLTKCQWSGLGVNFKEDKMGCCGRNTKRNKPPVDKRGNSLRKVAFLHPHQKKILEAEDKSIKEEEGKTE